MRISRGSRFFILLAVRTAVVPVPSALLRLISPVDNISSVELDACDNIKWISANKCESLELVELGTAPKLYDVQILDCNVEKLDITGCELMLKLAESSPEENERFIKYILDGDSDTGLRPYNLCIDSGMTLVTE